MNQVLKALISFSRKTDAAFMSFCQAVIILMTNNDNFPTMNPSLGALQEALEDYISALNNSVNRDRVQVALKNQRREQLELLMVQLVYYVNSTSMGNLVMLNSTGLEISKVRQPRIITTPENLRVTPGINPGSLDARVKAVAGSIGYNFEIAMDTADGNLQWTSTSYSRSKYTFTELEQGKKYWIRVAAVGANSQFAYSNTVAQYVL